ncbi:MAG: hypothetical protein WB774_02060 [Xanthobacteraceae bacterium]
MLKEVGERIKWVTQAGDEVACIALQRRDKVPARREISVSK